MKLLALYQGEAWKLQNLLKNYDDFVRFTAPKVKLNVKHESSH